MTLHDFPDLGTAPISAISAPQVINLLRPLETKGSLETVKRLSQRLNEIMTYGVNHANPLSGIRSVFKKPKKKNMASLAPDELKELMVAIANVSIKRTTRCLIEWQLNTMTRPAEAATARWADIEFEKRIWTIPAERMKKRRRHIVPLTDQTRALLEAIKPYSAHRLTLLPARQQLVERFNHAAASGARKAVACPPPSRDI